MFTFLEVDLVSWMPRYGTAGFNVELVIRLSVIRIDSPSSLILDAVESSICDERISNEGMFPVEERE